MDVLIAIGNSDNRLTQQEWSEFYEAVNSIIDEREVQVHGRWMTSSVAPYQNAAWVVSFSVEDEDLEPDILQYDILCVAKKYRQESIAWLQGTTQIALTGWYPNG